MVINAHFNACCRNSGIYPVYIGGHPIPQNTFHGKNATTTVPARSFTWGKGEIGRRGEAIIPLYGLIGLKKGEQ